MFSVKPWAQAYINSLEKAQSEVHSYMDDGIETLKVLASIVKSLPGAVFGRSVAEKLEAFLRTAVSSAKEITPPSFEAALRFIVLMVRKNEFRHIDLVIKEAVKIVNDKRGIVTVLLEHALPVEESFLSTLKEAVKKHTGASGVSLTQRLNGELLGGYKLRIGDDVIDSSVSSQLRRLLSAMESGGALPAGNLV